MNDQKKDLSIKIKKSEILNFIVSYFRYVILIVMIILDFVLFDPTLNMIISFSLFLIYIFIIIFTRKEYKKSKEKISKGFLEIKKPLDQLEENDRQGVEVLINSLWEILEKPDMSYRDTEALIIKFLEKKPSISNTLISYAKKNFPQLLDSYILLLNKHLDVEEYELMNFIISQRNEHYILWSLIYSLILTIWFIIISVSTFFSIYPYTTAFFGLNILLTIIIGDIQYIKKKKFRLGYYRYKKNKGFLKFHQKTLNLIWNNQSINIIEYNNDLSKKISKINSRIQNYVNQIKPSYEVLQKYQILTIIGIIITLLGGFTFNLIFLAIKNLSNLIQINIFNFFVYILFLYGFFISPILKERKESIIYKKLKELEPKLQQKLRLLYNMIFITLYCR